VGVIFPRIDGSGGFDAFTDTLALIERLDPRVVIPGHGAPFARAGGGIAAALERSRSRIAWFVNHPAQHALYAAKVLIKYQLLDSGGMTRAAFRAWLDAAPVLRQLHRQHRPDLSWDDWLHTVLTQLTGKDALRWSDTHVLDGA
jgi:glyoxylase-like metal-dependent hydrolase (beta-lactamase superfamily II)